MQGIEECSARKTYPQLPNHPIYLISVADAIMFWSILHEGIVVECLGRLPILISISFPNQAREVFLAQKSQDAIHIACQGRLVHKHLVPAQVVHNSY
jgi:hypothetical protein